MTDPPRQRLDLRGSLQAEAMAAVWRLGEGTVEAVRNALPADRHPAYTTVQTVLTRLAERGLLTRKRHGKAYVYRPAYDERDYLARTIGDTLAEARRETRQAALIKLVDGLDAEDLAQLARYATSIQRHRERK